MKKLFVILFLVVLIDAVCGGHPPTEKCEDKKPQKWCNKNKNRCEYSTYYLQCRKTCDKCIVGPPEGGLGAHCEEESDCIFDNQVCSPEFSVCVCADKYEAVISEQKCYPRLGGSCAADDECTMGPNQKCDNTTAVCICAEGFAEDRGRCDPRLGGPCDGNPNCTHNCGCNFPFQVCDANSSVCVCTDDFTADVNGTNTCLPDNPCTMDSDCSSMNNTMCETATGLCVCSLGFGPHGATGECEELFEGQCFRNEDCGANQECDPSCGF